MAKNARKRKANRSAERQELDFQSVTTTSSSSTTVIDKKKKKRVSWASQLESYQIQKFADDFNDREASISLATELLTSTPVKSALSPKYRKPKSTSDDGEDMAVAKKKQKLIEFDSEESPPKSSNENTPPESNTNTPLSKSLLKKQKKKAVALDDGDQPTTSGQKKKRPVKQGMEPVLAQINGPTQEVDTSDDDSNSDNEELDADPSVDNELNEDTKANNNEVNNHNNVDAANKKKKIRKNKPDPKRSLFVGNIPYEVTASQLASHFQERVGKVEHVHIQKDKRTRLPRGSGFVTFVDLDANQALAKLSGFVVQGRELRFKNIIKGKKNRQIAAANRPIIGQQKSMRKKDPEQHLRERLSNYIVSKKSFDNITMTNNKPKLPKGAIKAIRKRKNAKKKSLL